MYFICFKNFIRSGLTAINFVNIPFSIQKGRFLLLDLPLNAGGRLKICGILKASILSFLVLRKHGIFSVSNIGSLDYIDNLLDFWSRWVANYELFSIPIFILQRLLSYFPSIFIIYLFFYIYIYIYIFFFFAGRNSWCTELITFRYDKAKNLSMNSTNMIFKGWNRSLINLVFRLWMVFNKGVLL